MRHLGSIKPLFEEQCRSNPREVGFAVRAVRFRPSLCEPARLFEGEPFRACRPTSVELVERAFDLALDLRHPIYDCLYLALALDRGVRMVTADQGFVRAIRARTDLADRVVLLSELTH